MTIWVDSNAGAGTDAGTSWANAFLTLLQATATVAAGEDIWVASDHAESAATAKVFDVSGGPDAELIESPCRILSVASADDSLTAGASVTTTGANDITFEGSFHAWGIDFTSGAELNFGPGTPTMGRLIFEQCNFSNTGAGFIGFSVGGGDSIEVRLIDSNVTFTSATYSFYSGNGANFLWDGGTLVNNATNLIRSFPGPSTFLFRNVDLSAQSGNLIAVNVAFGEDRPHVVFERCVMHASVTLLSSASVGQPGIIAEMHHCQAGTDADPAYQTMKQDQVGNTVTDTARYRTGGASDGERTNPLSWSMTSTANAVELVYGTESLPIDGWTDGDGTTSHTYRIYIASGATLQDDEIWVDLTGPNDAATNSMGVRNTSRPAFLATPANITTDGASSWTGTDVGTLQQIDIAYTPDKPGQITARVYLGKASERVSIDPKIYVDP